MNVNGVLQDDQLELISSYFKQENSNLEILEFLKLQGITISISTLKRRLRTLGLLRCPMNKPLDELKRIIERELGGSGCFVGYRRVWARLRKEGYMVKRITVMKLLRELDPEGVESRKKKRLRRRIYHAKGPNFVWHIDGYDKLKPYGFCVHGAIVGFSRRLIWLEVGPTNNNPEVITKFYLDAVKQVGGLPRKVRSDDGTENSMVAAVHTFLRSSHSDEDAGLGCFLTGRSTTNQKIEAYWSHQAKDGPSCTGDYKTDADEDDVQEFYDHSKMFPPDYSDDFKEFVQTVMNERHLPEPQDVSSAFDLYMELLKEVDVMYCIIRQPYSEKPHGLFHPMMHKVS
ncbi:hypothetical protein AWC38_SpisGene23301 [Stylophora pistillata]|uniref:Integrase core domain-containing protein n=1 Tax=Stylophora pistillata TaxID=50429 RepID=A0A2B4R6A7_STYPI|nr:hypothetical protein AWC38_SpisGene23301 [Stylophora pistillata]